ncbi:MAG: OmpA family protein [Flavobacteriaceae bacterium]
MKKIFLSVMFTGAAVAANAQKVKVQRVKAINYAHTLDNWQVGVNVGGYTPTAGYPFFKSTRFNFGAEISKQISTGFRFGIDATAYINNNSDGYRNPLTIDYTNVAILANFNLNNIFGGYKGAPRKFEVEAFAGIGWLHFFYQGRSNDLNEMSAKYGANFWFNLGESRAWAIKFSPSILYLIDQGLPQQQANSLNSKFPYAQANLGLVYRFKGSNGKHYFTLYEPSVHVPVVEDNSAVVEDNSAALSQKERELEDAINRINQLERELETVKEKQQVETAAQAKKPLESIISFKQGRSIVEDSQLPNVERIATYLREYPNSRVVIKGFASPEGSVEANERIAKARAEAVKAILVKQYKIDAERIVAEGNGVGNVFSKPEWNRVSIVTIQE